jgi:hypothetical protein
MKNKCKHDSSNFKEETKCPEDSTIQSKLDWSRNQYKYTTVQGTPRFRPYLFSVTQIKIENESKRSYFNLPEKWMSVGMTQTQLLKLK